MSVDKCCVLNIGRSSLLEHNVSIAGHKLPTLLSCRDLGVSISHDLKPAEHIEQMVAKAHQWANIRLRYFFSRDVVSLVLAFVVYVRPLLSIIRSYFPHRLYVRDIELIERVQRRFTKRLPGFKTYCYDDRLSILRLPSLELRRLHIDLIMCYKIVFGIVVMLSKNIALTTLRQAFFSQRVIRPNI